MKVAANWQPIETAPTLRRVLVVEASGHMSIASYEFDLKMEMLWVDDARRNPNPTHWKPLPGLPPQSSSEREE